MATDALASTEVRIRLEGRLERLERANEALTALAAELDDRWHRRLPWQVERIAAVIAELPDIDEALSRAAPFAETKALRAAVIASRRRVEFLATAAWRSLGESPEGLSLEELLLNLVSQAPVEMGHSASAAGWYVGFTVLVCVAVVAFTQVWAVVATALFAIVLSIIAWYRAPRRVWEVRRHSLVIRTPEVREVPFSAIERIDAQEGTVVVHLTEDGVRVQESLDCDAPADLAALLALHRAKQVPRMRDRREDAVVAAAHAGDLSGSLLAFSRGAFFVHQPDFLRGFNVPPHIVTQELALLSDEALERVGTSVSTGEFVAAGQCVLLPIERPGIRTVMLGPTLEVTAQVTPSQNARLERWFELRRLGSDSPRSLPGA